MPKAMKAMKAMKAPKSMKGKKGKKAMKTMKGKEKDEDEGKGTMASEHCAVCGRHRALRLHGDEDLDTVILVAKSWASQIGFWIQGRDNEDDRDKIWATVVDMVHNPVDENEG